MIKYPTITFHCQKICQPVNCTVATLSKTKPTISQPTVFFNISLAEFNFKLLANKKEVKATAKTVMALTAGVVEGTIKPIKIETITKATAQIKAPKPIIFK